MSKLEQFLKELKLTPKQAGGTRRSKRIEAANRLIRSQNERRREPRKDSDIKKSRERIKEKKQETIQEARQEARQDILDGILSENKAQEQIDQQVQDQINQQANEQANEQEAINNMGAGQESTIIDDDGKPVTAKVEIDLGCNEVDDQDEDDENQDNEICNVPVNNILRINLDTLIKRIGTRRPQRTTQTIQSRIFDTVHELYGEGNLKAERKDTSFQNGQQNGVITIYNTGNLIERIKNTFNEYVYNDNTPINLNKSDILNILLYGVQKEVRGVTFRYKVEFPKPKLKRAVVGQNNTEKIDKTISCYNSSEERCGLYALLTELYRHLNRREDLIRSVILWFDTHHDFKAGKEGRYKKAENVWNQAFTVNGQRETFITWYASKFFTQAGINSIGAILYSFTDNVSQTDLGPVFKFINDTYPIRTNINRTIIPTLLYKISTTYLQNKNFEKSMLLHYIVHNFAVPINNSTALLRDILYVHRDTYNELLQDIRQKAIEINNNNTIDDPQKQKMLKAIALKLKPLNNLYIGIDDPNINDINDLQGINNFISRMTGPNNTFAFTDTLPRFTSSSNTHYVVDVNKGNYLLRNILQYVPAALFDSNGGNTYEPATTNNTAYDTFMGINPRVPNTPLPSSYNNQGGVNHLGNTYKYRTNGCKLEVTQNNKQVLTKADIRCSSKAAVDDDRFEIPDEAKNISYVKGYLTQKLRPIVPDDKFIVRMYKVLGKFVGRDNQFAIQKNRNTYTLTLPKYFNNVKIGPGIQDLVFLTILYRLENGGDLSLQLIDNIVNLKRVGDYGQVMDAKMANLPFFTTDNMESLMCIIEKVSCYIDFNQGLIIYDNGGRDADGAFVPEFIRSKGRSRDNLNPPGYGRRP